MLLEMLGSCSQCFSSSSPTPSLFAQYCPFVQLLQMEQVSQSHEFQHLVSCLTSTYLVWLLHQFLLINWLWWHIYQPKVLIFDPIIKRPKYFWKSEDATFFILYSTKLIIVFSYPFLWRERVTTSNINNSIKSKDDFHSCRRHTQILALRFKLRKVLLFDHATFYPHLIPERTWSICQ